MYQSSIMVGRGSKNKKTNKQHMPGPDTGPGNTSNLDDPKPGGGALVRNNHQGQLAKMERDKSFQCLKSLAKHTRNTGNPGPIKTTKSCLETATEEIQLSTFPRQ